MKPGHVILSQPSFWEFENLKNWQEKWSFCSVSGSEIPKKMLQGVNEEGLRWDFTNGLLEGLQTDGELTSHLAEHTVQCGVDQTKNPTVNSHHHQLHSTRRRVDFWATINTDSASLVSFSFSFPSRQAFRLERMQKSRIPTTSFRSIVDGYLSTLVSHLQWRGKSSEWRKCSSKTAQYAMIPHRQKFSLRMRVCPLLADRRKACARWARAFAGSKFETMASVSNHATRPYAIRPEEDNMYKQGAVSVWLSTYVPPTTFLHQFLSVS